ncbi:MAG: hypothetical protein WC969_04690 [Elusimicrobiota bacterium]|jgi:hypothetical protein
MNGALLAPFLALALAAPASAARDTAAGVQAAFTDLTACSGNPDAHPFCKLKNESYAPWDEASRTLVLRALSPIGEAPGSVVLEGAFAEHGIKGVHFIRMASGEDTAASIIFEDQVLVYLYPPFFAEKVVYGSWSQQSHVLAHEFFHDYARLHATQGVFSSPFYSTLTEALAWGYPKKRHQAVPREEYLAKLKLRNALVAEGKYADSVEVDLGYARSLGFPSLYSMTEVEEYFAELSAFLLHDSALPAQLPPAVTTWLRANDLAPLLGG